jgi:hypothetical protein
VQCLTNVLLAPHNKVNTSIKKNNVKHTFLRKKFIGNNPISIATQGHRLSKVKITPSYTLFHISAVNYKLDGSD